MIKEHKISTQYRRDTGYGKERYSRHDLTVGGMFHKEGAAERSLVEVKHKEIVEYKKTGRIVENFTCFTFDKSKAEGLRDFLIELLK